MFKPIGIFLSIVIVAQMNAMQDLNFFSKLPPDVWDLIASYLIFNDIETEEEFIERTKNGALCYKEEVHNGDEHQISSDCPRVNKIGVLRPIDSEEYLIIFHNKTAQELYRKPLGSNTHLKVYHRLILSRCADLFATIHSEIDRGWKTVLTIMAVDNNVQKQEFVIPEYFSLPQSIYPLAVAFNKQKTHIIMHGIDTQQYRGSARQASENPIVHHLIIPFTITLSSTAPKKKTLQHYFAHKGICKQISQ